MKVLLLSADYPPVPSGESNHAYYTALNLAKAGAEVTAVTSAIPSPVSAPGVRVLPVMKEWGWAELPRLLSLVREESPDAVFLVYLGMMYGDAPMVTFLPSILRRVAPAVRFVAQFEHLTYHEPIVGYRSRLVRAMARQVVGSASLDPLYGALLRDSHGIVVLSDMHRDHLVQRHPASGDRCHLIPPPPIMKVVPADDAMRIETRRRLGIAPDEFAFIYYGYIYQSKGVEVLLRAFARLSPDLRARLVIAGGFREHAGSEYITRRSKEYMQRMLDLPGELGIQSRVHWTGRCDADGSEASAFLNAADACVLPFDLGVHLNNSSVAAAMVHGLPVITTQAPTSESVFRHGENVLMSPPKDDQAMAVQLERAISDKTLRRRLMLGSRDMAEQWFSWEHAANRLLAVLSGASSGSRVGPESVPSSNAQMTEPRLAGERV